MTGNHFDTESLETFEHDLAGAGFKPVTVAGFPGWRGPIHQAFAGLTGATTLDVVIRPGWPFQSPGPPGRRPGYQPLDARWVRLPLAGRRSQRRLGNR